MTLGTEHLFIGSALGEVDAVGRVFLPTFVRNAMEHAPDVRRLVFGLHESDSCLTAYDPGYASILYADVERRRLREEAAGIGPDAHHARARRAFGMAEDAGYDDSWAIVLPPMARSLGAIEDLALFVGAGRHFEVWNPHVARLARDPGLRELAERRLGPGIDKAIDRRSPQGEEGV